MSTAMERIMRARGDLQCLHEPFMYDYYVHRNVRRMPHFHASSDHPTAYPDIRDMLLKRAEVQAVFLKDMSYYVVPQMLDDAAFCRRVTHCFLIRDPKSSIVSYHKLDGEVTLEEIGLEAQWMHFSGLEALLGHAPLVIEAEDVRADAKGTIASVWDYMDLPFVEQAFDWSRDTTPKDWEQVNAWHSDVSSSRSIRTLSPQEMTAKATEFETRVQSFPHLQDYLEHHLPFYSKLKTQAERQKSP